MATFELGWLRTARTGTRQAVRSRFAPLYVAGLVVGAGLGVALATVGAHGGAPPALTPRSQPVVLATDFLLPRSAIRPEPAPAQASAPAIDLPPTLPPFGAESAQPWEALQAAPAAESGKETAPTGMNPAASPALSPPAPTTSPSTPSAPSAASQPAPPVTPAKPNFYLPEAPRGPASELEYRLFAAANAEREKAGLPPLLLDEGLSHIARIRVRQLVDQNYFAHVDPFGYRMYVELLAHFGYDSYAWAGENLAMNNYSVAESPERAMVAFMNSPSHRANILSRDFGRVGIGELTTADGRHFYAMIFLG